MFQTTGTFSFSSRQFLCFFFHLNCVSAKLQVLLFSALLDFLEFAFATLSRSCGFIQTAVSMCCYFFILEKYRDSNKSNNLPPHWKAVFLQGTLAHIKARKQNWTCLLTSKTESPCLLASVLESSGFVFYQTKFISDAFVLFISIY